MNDEEAEHTSDTVAANASTLEARFDLIVPQSGTVAAASARLDTVGDTDHLAAVLAHLAGVRAAAEHRLLTTASQLHEECEEAYLVAIAERRGDAPTSREGFAAHAEQAAAGVDPFEKYGPTGLESAIAEIGAALNTSVPAARRLIETGHALRYRLPKTGEQLAQARIDRPRFDAVVRQTALVADELIAAVDAALSAEIEARPAMAFARFTTMVDSVVARVDAEALELRREQAARERDVTVRGDRKVPGQARLTGRLSTADGAALDAALRGMASAVHSDDPRTAGQRRVDALVALTQGRRLLCRCPGCAAAPDTDQAVDAAAGQRPAGSWFHIVVNLSTLLGADDAPAFVDGFGVIDADTARTLLAEAKRSYVHTAAAGGGGYAPSGRLADLLRCGELWCSFPGCTNRAMTADLDHMVEYADGGATSPANLAPLCRLHHRVKTFTDWRDYRDRQGRVVMVSPSGRVTVGTGFAGTDLFPALTVSTPATGADCLRDKAGRERDRLRRLKARREADEPPPPF